MPYIYAHLPGGGVKTFRITRSPSIIGRSKEVDICIPHSTVSRKHAKLEKLNETTWSITDLGSRNGLFANNRKIKSGQLTDGSEIYIGKEIKLTFRISAKTQEDQDKERTAAKSSDKSTYDIKMKKCPACGAEMPPEAIVCLTCGFNIKLGKRMQVMVETGGKGSRKTKSPSSSTVTGSEKKTTTDKSKPTGPSISKEQKEKIIHQFLPIGLILIFFVISGILATKANVSVGGFIFAQALSLIFRTIFLTIAMAIAARIGSFGFGNYKDAITKIIAIASAMGIIPMVGGIIINMFLPLLILFALLKLFFDLDLFEMFLIIGVMFILNSFVLSFVMGIFMSLTYH